MKFLLPVIAALLVFASCQKQVTEQSVGDSIDVSVSGDAAIYNQYADCKLRTITHLNRGVIDDTVKGTFVYHPDGLPDRLIYDKPGTGNPNIYFVYDNKRRLREYRAGQYPSEEKWHKYGYNAANQIILDTIYNLLVPNGDKVSTITYDGQGRIISENIKVIKTGATTTVNYAYDSRGNLQVDGWAASKYDNNVSIFRAHPLFQFIHRNYSKNNAAPQSKYNASGLPLSNTPSNDIFFNDYSSESSHTGIIKATYDCDGFVPANEFLYCKLRTITHELPMDDGPNAIIKGTFVYYPDGLPDNLTYPDYPVGYYFIYDNKRRLRELRFFFSRNDRGWPGSKWHRYGYNSAGQITTDTIIGPYGESESISTLSYDAQGRVSKEDRNYYHNGAIFGTRNDTFKYDSRGNLIVDGWPSSSYDNKVSIYRAHSLFQFIHRNYSKNNASAQTKYNSKGLPLSSKSMNGSFFNPSNADDRSSSSLVSANYDCP